jgi:AraC family transcriptional regulator of adaptative response / DNA-3-methyladenine glycosylase II
MQAPALSASAVDPQVCEQARLSRDARFDGLFFTERTLENFVARWVALPGIAHYIALRALGHHDAFPAGDLVLQRALPDDGSHMGEKALAAQAEAWRPWRAYAVIHLWRDAMAAPRQSAA